MNPVNLYGLCLHCNLAPDAGCSCDFSARCPDHSIPYRGCWENGFRCAPPRTSERRRPETSSETVPGEPVTPTGYGLDELMSQLRLRNQHVADWENRQYKGSISLDGKTGKF